MAVVPHQIVQQDLLNKFFQKHDPARTLLDYRNFVPKIVLERFCNGNEQNTYVVRDPYHGEQVYNRVGKILTLYNLKDGQLVSEHLDRCFGKANIYSSYLDNYTAENFRVDKFKKLITLKEVDSKIYSEVTTALWTVLGQYDGGVRCLSMTRKDHGYLRKALYLMASLGNRDKSMHVFAHHELMERARQDRRQFTQNHNLDHVRDVWLRNVQLMLDSQHHAIATRQDIFDIDRHDYQANARNRFLVFWEAPPGEEFLLTETAFGGYEGSEIAIDDSQVNTTDLEIQKRVYTKDFMWHQIFVLSPKLCVVLCHPALLDYDQNLAKAYAKKWGLRPSILEKLPHEYPPQYYAEMSAEDCLPLYNYGLDRLPNEVKQKFAMRNPRGVPQDETLMFPIQPLTRKQVTLVNSALLQNQKDAVPVNNVCMRPSETDGSYRSLLGSLKRFQKTRWNLYSKEMQNDYAPLLQLVGTPAGTPPEYVESVHSASSAYGGPAEHRYSSMSYAVTAAGVPVPFEHLDPGHHLQLRTQSQSSHGSFTPSSGASYYSSTSSQSSTASTKTASVDVPAFQHQEIRDVSPPQKQPRQPKVSSATHSPRGSEAGGKIQRMGKPSTNEWREPVHPYYNRVVDPPVSGPSSQSSGGVPVLRGHNQRPAQHNPPSNQSSQKGSPNPTRAEPEAGHHQRYQEPSLQQMAPPTRTAGDRSNHSEHARPKLQDRSRTEPQLMHSLMGVSACGPTTYGPGLIQYKLNAQTPGLVRGDQPTDAPALHDSHPQPPRRRSPERPQLHRSAGSAPAAEHMRERTNSQRSDHSDSRGRPVKPERRTQAPAQHTAHELERVASVRSNGSQRSHRSNSSPHSRNPQAIEERMEQVFSPVEPARNGNLSRSNSRHRAVSYSQDTTLDTSRQSALALAERQYHSESAGRVHNPAHTQNTRNSRRTENIGHSEVKHMSHRSLPSLEVRPPQRIESVAAEQARSPVHHQQQAQFPSLHQQRVSQLPQGHPQQQHNSAHHPLQQKAPPQPAHNPHPVPTQPAPQQLQQPKRQQQLHPQLQLPQEGHAYPFVGPSQSVFNAVPSSTAVPAPVQPGSRHTSTSSEHPMVRPGVELVPARPAHGAPPSVVVEQVTRGPAPQSEPPKTPAKPDNHRVQQLRFETPHHHPLNRRLSDASIAGSMIAQDGDSPAARQYERYLMDREFSDEESENSGGVEEDSEITSCEDNAAEPYVPEKKQEVVEAKPPGQRTVRFAEPEHSPVRSTQSERARKAQETQAPPAFEQAPPQSNRFAGFTSTKQQGPPTRR